MNENNQILTLRDNAKAELLQIKTVEDGISYLNKLKAIDVWVKAEKKDAELQNIVAEQKLRTQRILGQLIQESEITKGGNPTMVARDHHRGRRETLNDIGLNKHQSSAFQQIASIPEETFEGFISEKKAAVNNAVAELTTTGAVRLAKSLEQKKKDLDLHLELQEELDTEKELKKIAHNINITYTKDQRKFFITLIKI